MSANRPVNAANDGDQPGVRAPASRPLEGLAAEALIDLEEAHAIVGLGVWTWTVGTQHMLWSREVYRITGWDAKGLVPTLDAIIARIHPDDRPAAVARLTEAAGGDEPRGHEFRIVRPSGEVRHCWVKIRPVKRAGAVLTVRGVVLDLTERRATELQLQESEAHQRSTVELNPQIPWIANAEGEITEISSRWLKRIGLSQGEARESGWTHALHPDDVARVSKVWSRALASGQAYDSRYRLRLKDGSYHWFRSRGAPRRDDDGNILRWYGVLEDIDDQIRAEAALKEVEERYRLAARATNDLIWDHDLLTDAISWNDSPDLRFGYPTDELGETVDWWVARIHPDDRLRVAAAVEAVKNSDVDQYVEEYRFRRGDGGYAHACDRGYILRDADGRPVRLVGAMQDVTERKRAAAALLESQTRLRWGATHDALTGVANRSLFQAALADAISDAAERGRCVGLLELDVDELKHVNDTLGHDAGDALLRTLVGRLGDLLRPGETLARLGGDEFAIVIPDLDQAGGVDDLVTRIITRMREPFLFEGHTLDCRTTIGSSLYPRHGRTPEELLKSADIALFGAKAAARGQHLSFAPEMRAELQNRISMLHVARDALAADCIMPFYQPKVTLSDGRITGFEALLRWRDRRGVEHGPNTVAAAFDDHALAAEISNRMVELSVADMRRWLDKGVDFGHVAVNAAAAEFRREDFAERILEELRTAGVPTRHFQLEVTETVILGRGAESVERALRMLSAEGIRIALDDFGTGYASLRHLNRFPVDILKIDQSFVRGMAADAGDAAIIRTLLSLGQSLDIDVVAEGIETQAQADELRRFGCLYGQGYLFAKAVAADAVPMLIARGHPGS